jgi:aminoglycoside phosphotransferase (APT) family kinase protein
MKKARKSYIAWIMAVRLNPVRTLSEAEAQAMVDRIAPDRKVARVSALRQGEIGTVFAIDLLDDATGYVFKAYPESLRWKIAKELFVAGLRDGRLGVPTPRIVLAEEDFLVMTRLPGSDLISMEATLAPAPLISAYEQMGRAMREVHRIELKAFGYIASGGILQPADSNRIYMQAQFDRKLSGFAQLGGEPELARELSDYVADRLMLLDSCTSPRLVHYDFHTGNMLAERRVDPRGETIVLTGVLDWENAIAGDPLMDLAKTLAYSVRGDRTKHAALLAGYGTIDRPRWRETVALYEFYGLIELWAWWTQIGDHQRARTLVPELKRFASSP